jgi:hypothetical protein
VLFTTAVDIISTLAAAQSAGQLKREIRHYLRPTVLIVDSCDAGSYVELPQCESYFARRLACRASDNST